MINSILSWKVGNGSQVRVGVDSIIGCDKSIILFEELIYSNDYESYIKFNVNSNIHDLVTRLVECHKLKLH